MNKYIEIAIIVFVLSLALFLFKSAFGQSIGDLQNQVNNDTAYRNELVNYLHSHNMTVNDTQLKVNELMNISTLETYELEAVVKGHMNDCQTGTFERIAETSNLSKAEMSEKYGDC
jgi:hypothetical protein